MKILDHNHLLMIMMNLKEKINKYLIGFYYILLIYKKKYIVIVILFYRIRRVLTNIYIFCFISIKTKIIMSINKYKYMYLYIYSNDIKWHVKNNFIKFYFFMFNKL